ncbi:MAG TPA: hypothetical protein VG370_19025 [Chloroflexota bacterium]|jgi:hypothetical protein|nr:hypothetical protein [Chloroflexota bacterium]
MDLRRGFLDLPMAPAVEPALDRRVDIASLGYPWLIQCHPRSPIAVDTLIPEEWPDLGPILDLLDL